MSYLLNPNILKPQVTSYRYIKWYITNVRTFSTANSVQVSEFNILNDGSNISLVGKSISNPGGSNPASENPPKLIDGSVTTKWLDFNIKSSSTGFTSTIIVDFGSSVTFNSYRWYTANDAIERDPKSWQLLGSNDNSNYTLLHTVTDFTSTTGRRVLAGTFTF